MPFAIFKSDKTIDALVARLFPKSGRTKTAAKQAASALLKANPQLKDLGTVPAGSILVIPDTLPALALAEQVAPPSDAFVAATKRALETLNLLALRLDAIDTQAQAAARSLADLSQPGGLARSAVPDLFNLPSLLPAGKNAAQKRVKDLEASRKARTDLFTSLQQQLAALGKQ